MFVFIKRCLLAGLLMAMPLMAMAVGSARIHINGGEDELKLAWQDTHTLRIQVKDNPGSYVIMRDDMIYMVINKGDTPRVFAGSQSLAKMMSGILLGQNGMRMPRLVGIKSTGEAASVAGIDGHVYKVDVIDSEGKAQTLEAVLTQDAQVVEMSDALMTTLGGLVDDASRAVLMHDLPAHERGVLAVGDDWQLVSISHHEPAASQFQLPAKPLGMGDYLQQIIKGMQ